MRRVYADNSATTALSKTALDAMMPYLTNHFGNPSSIYGIGQSAKRAISEARERVAAALGADPAEIFFTGGGTESDNWALHSALELSAKKGKHIITSPVEHHAITHVLDRLKKKGCEVTELHVDQFGNLSLDELKNAIRPDTVLITIMASNNEIGTIYPTAEIGAIAKEAGILFHSDAVQSVGHVPVNVKEMNVDILSLSAHKFRGPKGVGALYIRKGLRLPAFISGGGQERNLRSGTENVAGILGMAAALDEAVNNMDVNIPKVSAMRDKLIAGLTAIPYSRLTGDPKNRLPGVASFVFECIEGESLVLMLDAEGVCASSGSACSSNSLDPSHVLMAIGLPHEIAHGSIRLSLNEENTDEDIDYLLQVVPTVVEKLRAMSPLWEEKMG